MTSLPTRLLRAVGLRRPSPQRPATVEEMLPRPGLFSVGNGDFVAIGRGLLAELRDECGLAPHHHVLDVGCGTGRIAIPMTQYLSPEGRYEGFDPAARAIDHCRRRITPSYPHFRFQVADLHNEKYNPAGRFQDSEYRFPFPDGSFDLVFAVSVFTHLLPAGSERYVTEAARVLKPGGHFFATYFLLDAAAVAAIEGGLSALSFPARDGVYRTHDPQVPEAAVAYDEAFVLGLYEKNRLRLERPPRRGLWSGRPGSGYGGYQDLLVATKAAAATP